MAGARHGCPPTPPPAPVLGAVGGGGGGGWLRARSCGTCARARLTWRRSRARALGARVGGGHTPPPPPAPALGAGVGRGGGGAARALIRDVRACSCHLPPCPLVVSSRLRLPLPWSAPWSAQCRRGGGMICCPSLYAILVAQKKAHVGMKSLRSLAPSSENPKSFQQMASGAYGCQNL